MNCCQLSVLEVVHNSIARIAKEITVLLVLLPSDKSAHMSCDLQIILKFVSVKKQINKKNRVQFMESKVNNVTTLMHILKLTPYFSMQRTKILYKPRIKSITVV